MIQIFEWWALTGQMHIISSNTYLLLGMWSAHLRQTAVRAGWHRHTATDQRGTWSLLGCRHPLPPSWCEALFNTLLPGFGALNSFAPYLKDIGRIQVYYILEPNGVNINRCRAALGHQPVVQPTVLLLGIHIPSTTKDTARNRRFCELIFSAMHKFIIRTQLFRARLSNCGSHLKLKRGEDWIWCSKNHIRLTQSIPRTHNIINIVRYFDIAIKLAHDVARNSGWAKSNWEIMTWRY